jgi:hypothetical protein
MRITVTKTTPASTDGLTVELYRAGQTYDLAPRLAEVFQREGWGHPELVINDDPDADDTEPDSDDSTIDDDPDADDLEDTDLTLTGPSEKKPAGPSEKKPARPKGKKE